VSSSTLTLTASSKQLIMQSQELQPSFQFLGDEVLNFEKKKKIINQKKSKRKSF
jgi:hypothetical protein